MRFTHHPLAVAHLTQPFGTNWAKDDLYKKMGMLGHNGLDYRAPLGTPCYAVADGWYEPEEEGINLPRGYGINGRLWIDDGAEKLEVIYGHLQKNVAARGLVRAGDVVGLADSTGASTGHHLHFGVRRHRVLNNTGGREIVDVNNGFFGWVDPAPYLPDAVEFYVDKRYGQPRSVAREVLFKPSYLWFKRKTGRYPKDNEVLAFIYGYWPYEAVIDPAMYVIWREMTFPDYAKLLKRPPEELARGLRGY